MITPTSSSTAVLGIIGSFQVFTTALRDDPAAARPTRPLFYVLYLYQNGFQLLQDGLRLGAGLGALPDRSCASRCVQFRVARRWVYYEGGERGAATALDRALGSRRAPRPPAPRGAAASHAASCVHRRRVLFAVPFFWMVSHLAAWRPTSIFVFPPAADPEPGPAGRTTPRCWDSRPVPALVRNTLDRSRPSRRCSATLRDRVAGRLRLRARCASRAATALFVLVLATMMLPYARHADPALPALPQLGWLEHASCR